MIPENKVCQNCKQEFIIEPEDFDFYKKIEVPVPTFCPECRAIRRLIFWNEHYIFRNDDAATGKEIFSSYPRQSGIKLYDRDYWWSDAWDPMRYGKEYDFSRLFFRQLKEIFYAVPRPSRSIQDFVNSDYCDQATGLKNCYLCFNGGFSENCAYGVAFTNMRSSIDFYAATSSELCYECYQTSDSYKVFFGEDAMNCLDGAFLLNCVDCQNCFGCVNLRHKKYHIFNKAYTKEEYEKKIKNFDLGSYEALEKLKEEFEKFRLLFPVKYIHSTADSVNVSGDYVYHSKNARYCYEAGAVEDSKFIQNVAQGTKDSYDYSSWGENSELMYDSISCGRNCQRMKFCFDCWPACENLEYCFCCHSSSDCFGCVGLQKKQYCILNKQYTKNEYENLVKKIKAHMNEIPYIDKKENVYRYGEFLPFEFSPFAYNETKVQDYYPITKEEAEKQGYAWRDIEKKNFQATVLSSNLPDHIKDASQTITNELVSCGKCRRAYRIIPSEFEFYKKFELALPRLCQDCRYFERLKRRNPLTLWHRKCMKSGCPNEFETSYPPERPEVVYCEQCYQQEVI